MKQLVFCLFSQSLLFSVVRQEKDSTSAPGQDQPNCVHMLSLKSTNVDVHGRGENSREGPFSVLSWAQWLESD